jgi:dimethylglycine dehydrogenase
MADRARIVIIGGGIAGCSALYHLARMGCTDVLLLERNELTSGSTWHAAGNVPTYSTSWSIMKLQSYSAALYRQLAADPDFPISYHVTGSVRLAHSHERLAEFKHVTAMANAQGMGYDILTPTQLVDHYPLVRTHDLVGALWDPLDGDIDPSQVTQALARGARRLGARIRRFERVVGLVQRADHGWTVQSRTTAGEETKTDCEIVVNAAGYRAGEVMALIGRHHPIAQMSHQYYVTEEIPELAARATPLPLLRDPDTSYYLRQERNSYVLGPYEWQATAMWRDGIPDEFANMLWSDDLERLAPRSSTREGVCPFWPMPASLASSTARSRTHPMAIPTSGPSAACATSGTATRSASASPRAVEPARRSPSGSSTAGPGGTCGRSTGAVSRATPPPGTRSTKRSRCTRTSTP